MSNNGKIIYGGEAFEQNTDPSPGLGMGEIRYFTNPPSDPRWLKCDGNIHKRSSYPAYSEDRELPAWRFKALDEEIAIESFERLLIDELNPGMSIKLDDGDYLIIIRDLYITELDSDVIGLVRYSPSTGDITVVHTHPDFNDMSRIVRTPGGRLWCVGGQALLADNNDDFQTYEANYLGETSISIPWGVELDAFTGPYSTIVPANINGIVSLNSNGYDIVNNYQSTLGEPVSVFAEGSTYIDSKYVFTDQFGDKVMVNIYEGGQDFDEVWPGQTFYGNHIDINKLIFPPMRTNYGVMQSYSGKPVVMLSSKYNEYFRTAFKEIESAFEYDRFRLYSTLNGEPLFTDHGWDDYFSTCFGFVQPDTNFIEKFDFTVHRDMVEIGIQSIVNLYQTPGKILSMHVDGKEKYIFSISEFLQVEIYHDPDYFHAPGLRASKIDGAFPYVWTGE